MSDEKNQPKMYLLPQISRGLAGKQIGSASLNLSPQAGMTAPFSFGDTLPQELWDAMIGLGMNPDQLLPPLSSELLLGKFGPQTFVAPGVVVIPEPGVSALAAVGLFILFGCWRRFR